MTTISVRFLVSLGIVKKNFEMTKLLVFLVLCIVSASCVELENVCSSDHFEYNGVLVNAFYKSPVNITFPGLSHFLINNSVTCDPSEFVNRTNFFEAIKIKNNFNRKFAELYTNDLNGNTADEFQRKRFELVGYWSPLYRMKEVEPTSTCVKTFERMITSATHVFENLEEISKYNKYPIWGDDFKPSSLEAIQILEKLFEKLEADGDGQTFALKNEKAFSVYHRTALVLPREFKFLTDGSVQPDTESMFTFEQYLPFNSDRHTDKGCVPVEELPRFYKYKGSK